MLFSNAYIVIFGHFTVFWFSRIVLVTGASTTYKLHFHTVVERYSTALPTEIPVRCNKKRTLKKKTNVSATDSLFVNTIGLPTKLAAFVALKLSKD